MKTRDSNLELYRIIMMLLIVAHHYVINSGLDAVIMNEEMSIKSISFLVLGMWGKIAINGFVLITGYYMCTSNKISVYKIWKLTFEVVFYNIVITAIFMMSGYQEFTMINCIKAIWPIWSIGNDFVPCFIIFYLTIPFWNILIRGMNHRLHLSLLLLLVGLYSFYGSIPVFSLTYNYITWFGVLYIVASYIRLYQSHWINIIGSMGGLVFLVFLVIVSVIFATYWKIGSYGFVTDCHKLPALLVAVSSFVFFKNLKIPYNKLINITASSVFGVLCIHANSDTMRWWLWKDVVRVKKQYEFDYAILLAISSIFIIFFCCVMIDQLRIRYVERSLFKRF